MNATGVYRVQLQVQWWNRNTNQETGHIYAILNSNPLSYTTIRTDVEAGLNVSTTLEFIYQFSSADVIEFAFSVSDTQLQLRAVAAATPYPDGASSYANIIGVY